MAPPVNPKDTTPVEAPAPAENTKPMLETAHVLLMDIVGYSSLLIDEQTERLQELKSIVRNTKEFQKAQLEGQLLRLPTGDGMALSFFGDPEAPVRCAVEISRALPSHPDLKLRLGIHSGLVYRIADINENLNIAGGGINIAQRVMDCGDAGHIILSKRVADDLGQLSRWARDLHDLGEVVVKHGVRLHIYSLHNDEIGNAAQPAKLSSLEKSRRPSRAFLIIALLVILAVIGAGVFFALKFVLTPRHTLTYSLTVQKMLDGQPLGGEIQSTGDELYGNGWKFRVNVTPAEAGSLYMLNEGKEFNVLFPTPANNNSVAQLSAHAIIQTGWYVFDNQPLPEKVWIIWSVKPVAQLDAIFRDAVEHKLVISDPEKIKVIRDLIARSSTAEVSVDKVNKFSIIKGRGDVVVALLTLNHNAY